MARSELQERAARELANMRGFVRRPSLTGWVARTARPQFERATRAVLAVEDVEGVEAAGPFADRLRDLRREAMERGLLTAGEVVFVDEQVARESGFPRSAIPGGGG